MGKSNTDIRCDRQIYISVQSEDFDIGQEYAALTEQNTLDGAIVTFVGCVRDFSANRPVDMLSLEHYPGMTEKVLSDICDEAQDKWQLGRIRVIHRVGQLALSEQIVFVGVSAMHRHAAFEGAQFIMDYLKTRAPFWKKESGRDGDLWVKAKDSDEQVAQKW